MLDELLRLEALKPETADGNGATAGFWLNELYSPWSSPASMARAFMDAQGHPEKLKTWINTSLGET